LKAGAHIVARIAGKIKGAQGAPSKKLNCMKRQKLNRARSRAVRLPSALQN
jgi:hypothetical protein